MRFYGRIFAVRRRAVRFAGGLLPTAGIVADTAGSAVADGVANVHGGRAHPHQILRQVLKNPLFHQWQLKTYHRAPKSALDSYFAKVLRTLRHLLDKMWNWHSHNHFKHSVVSPAGTSAFPYLLGILGKVLIILAVIAAIFLLINLLVNRNKNSAPPEPPVDRRDISEALQEGDALALESDQWLNKAREFESSGEFRLMYRALYLALLAGLHEKGKIRFRRTATNNTLVRGFIGNSSDRTIFGSLTDRFDHVWYGWKVYPAQTTADLKSAMATLLAGENRHA